MRTLRPSGFRQARFFGVVVAADHVQNDVGSAFGLDPLHEIFRLGVDRDVGAELQRRRRLICAATGGDHLGARRLGHLDRHDADAGCASMHHKGLAGFEGSAFQHIREDGEGGFRQGGGLHQAQPLGNGQNVPGVDPAILRVAAPAEKRADLIADRPPGRVFADRGHLSRNFQAQCLRRAWRRRIKAHALNDVGPIHAGGLHADQEFARTRFGGWDLGRLQRVGCALAALRQSRQSSCRGSNSR